MMQQECLKKTVRILFFGFQVVNNSPRHEFEFRIHKIHYSHEDRVRNSRLAACSSEKFRRLHFQRGDDFRDERRTHKLRSCFDDGKMLLRNVEHFRELRLREIPAFSELPQILAKKFRNVNESFHIENYDIEKQKRKHSVME